MSRDRSASLRSTTGQPEAKFSVGEVVESRNSRSEVFVAIGG